MLALILLMHTHVYKFIMPARMFACVHTYVCACMRVCMFHNNPPPSLSIDVDLVGLAPSPPILKSLLRLWYMFVSFSRLLDYFYKGRAM